MLTDSHTTEREHEIRRILAARKPLANQAALVLQVLVQSKDALRSLRATRDALLPELEHAIADGEESAQPPEQRLRSLDFDSLLQRLDQHEADVARMQKRLARETLNIGVVGYAGEGKSTLLQTLSGLDDTALPTGDRGHVTGARSIIRHSLVAEPTAEVWFHDTNSFLREVIWPYFERPSLHLGRKPQTLEEFVRAKLDSDTHALDVTDKGYVERLRGYQTELDDYIELLSTPSPTIVVGNNIRTYVVYPQKSSPLQFHRQKPYYRAVKDVRIACRFPYEDVGAIALVDLPGLGDHNVNDARLLARTLGTDVDFALFLKRPTDHRAYIGVIDTDIYDLAKAAIPELPIERWSMFILNLDARPGHDNSKQCQDCVEEAAGKGMRVLRSCVVDCTNRDDVGVQILDPALAYLATHISDLDHDYVRACEDGLRQTREVIGSFNAAAEQCFWSLRTAEAGGDTESFMLLFDQLWDDLGTGLKSLVESLRTRRSVSSVDVSAALNAALDRCGEYRPPCREEIAKHAQRYGPGTAFEYYLNRSRAFLVRQFEAVDGDFHAFLESAKQEVVDILRDNGRLADLGSDSGSEFMSKLAADIRATVPQHATAELPDAVMAFADARLSYRGFIQHRVRACLDRLDPTAVARTEITGLDSAESIEFLLAKHYELTVGDVKAAIMYWSQEPNAVAFALVEEFVDRALYGDFVHQAWRSYYNARREQLWPRHFGSQRITPRLRDTWVAAVSQGVGRLSVDSLSLGFRASE